MAGLPAIKSIGSAIDPRAIDRRSGKPKRVPKKIKEVVRLLLSGECTTVKAAGQRAGLTSESYLSVALRQPHVAAYIDERTRATLAEGKTIAAARLLNLIHSKSDHVSFDASVHALGINGIAPPERGSVNVQINNNAPAGYIIDFRDPRRDPEDATFIDVTPSRSDEP